MNIRVVLLALCLFPAAASASGLAERRADFRAALERVERGGPLSGDARRGLLDHPLFAYLEYAELRAGLDKADAAAVDGLLARHPDFALATRLRDQWLQELARRGNWSAVLAQDAAPDSVTNRCHRVNARLKRSASAEAFAAAEALWRTGDSAPSACDAVFSALQAAGRLTPALRWERIELAAAAGNAGLMRFVARGLPEADAALAARYADFLEHARGEPASWPQDARSARMLAAGLQRLARGDRERADRLADAHAGLLRRAPEAMGQARHAVALWTAANYESDATARFAKVPEAAFDDRLHEWRVREALSRGDRAAASLAVAAMPGTLRTAPRWRYLGARLDQLQGRREAAAPVFAELAREAHYHGFLAADQIGAPYALCPLDLPRDAALRQDVSALPGLVRALELHAMGRHSWALAEWNAAIAGLDDTRRRAAVELAVKSGWTDRAVFDLARGDDLRFYRLRFPLAHQRHLKQEATQRNLDPAWVAALIRAESAWNPVARSHADARGLMQLLPGTGRDTARRLGIGWQGPQQLYQAQSNITLGTAYLADMLARKAEQPYLATAAYNAGPAPVARWKNQRPPSEVDLWIETIPFWETRDYVVRVMAFSVIYDWRLGQDAYPLERRLRGQPDPRVTRSPFACPASDSVAKHSP